MSRIQNEPLIPASVRLPELTFKAIIIAIIMAAVLAAANAYLALKIGTTISASIPASILAIGILRFFKTHNVLECNIIQTAASAGEGVAAAIAFVLPGMIFIHAWTEFSFVQTFLIVIIGGILGVAFSVPLRRVLLELPTLRFPEGTAIGMVLKASAQTGTQLRLLTWGSAAGALITFAQSGLKVIASDLQIWGTQAGTIFGVGIGFTPATFAAGYIVGIRVAISLIVGIIFNWFIVLPILSAHTALGADTAYNNAMSLWSTDLRFVGVGTMLVGGIWTILRLLKPIAQAIKTSWAVMHRSSDQAAAVPRTEKDIPIFWVLASILVMLVLSFIFIYHAFSELTLGNTHNYFLWLTIFSSLYIIVVGFILSAVCGYFTGLVGSTNNPLSGVLLMAIILLGLIYFLAFHALHMSDIVDATAVAKISAILVMITAIIAGSASISNENIQDLKAGQMVGASPWKQQVMLIIGVVVSALVIGPVLNLLYHAYGIAGVFPHPGMDPSHMLPAPQASLIAAVASGVLTLHLKWKMIITGIAFGIVVIIVDEILKKRGERLPALAVGLGMYLPMEITVPIIFGGLVSSLAKRKHKQKQGTEEQWEHSYQKGTLLASGLVAGGAIMGVLLAIPFVIAGSSDVLTIMPQVLTPVATILGALSIIGLGYWLYKQ